MAYLIWTITGAPVSALLHRAEGGNIAASIPASVFGVLLSGIIGIGIAHADYTVTLPGALGAVSSARRSLS
jgi:hypothetical protein